MIDVLTPANVLVYSTQVAIVAIAAWAVQAVLRVNAPGVSYAYWRGVLALCVILPWLQTPQPAVRSSGVLYSFSSSDSECE